MNAGRLLVLTGFSGAGKDTVMKSLVQKHGWGNVITYSAGRSPRPGEIPGEDYHFVQELEFIQMRERGDFLEYVRYGETWKGTTKQEIAKVAQGEKVIWRIDPTAAAKVEEIIKSGLQQPLADQVLNSLVKIFLIADDETIKHRVSKRNPGGDPEAVRRRVEADKKIWQELVVEQRKFPYVVENREGELEKTIEQIIKIVMEK